MIMLKEGRVLPQLLGSLLFLFCFLPQGLAWAIPAMIAWLCHELGHYIAALLLGFQPSITGIFGALLISPRCQGWRESLVAAAGPAINLLLMVLLPGQWSFCQGLLAIGNLLPVLPLDGGRLLRGLLTWLDNWLFWTKALALCGMALGLVLAVLGFLLGYSGFGGLITGIILFYLAWREWRFATLHFWQAILASPCQEGWVKHLALNSSLPITVAVKFLRPGYRCQIETENGEISGAAVITAFVSGNGSLPISLLLEKDFLT